MTSFIGGEYLIAFGLINGLSKGNDSISFAELRELANKMQQRFNESDIDAVVVDHSLQDVIYSYDKYFDFVVLNHIPYAKCKPGIGIQDLQHRFVGYIPIHTLSVMMECIKG